MTQARQTSTNEQSLKHPRWHAIVYDVEMSDVLILLYVVVFVRQYFWIVGHNLIAWALTLIVSLAIWGLHLHTKEHTEEKSRVQFWFVIAVPLLLFYGLRAAFPDTSFDILDYRLINAERALRGFPFRPGDFFPVRFPFNPAPDMLTGIARHLLGYRLGTILNFFVLLWVGRILDQLLVPYIKRDWWRWIAVLLLLLTENALFTINNYMVDLLALPLLLESARLALDGRPESHQRTIQIALMLGAAVAVKLINLAFALPIILIYGYRWIKAKSRRDVAQTALLFVVSFLVPLLPYTLYIYLQTGNPIFPLYNKVFRSPFWPTSDYGGIRWGPVVDDPRFANMRWWEIVAWPILVPFRIEHIAGDLGRHAGRLSIAFIAAVAGLVVKRKGDRIWLISFLVVVGAVLWSSISGMPRYALYLELMGGLAAVCLLSNLSEKASSHQRLLGLTAQVFVIGILVIQSVVSCLYAYRFQWGSRPTVFDDFKGYINDARFVFRDYSLARFLPPKERESIQPAEVWVESSALESGIQVSLKNDLPALCVYMPEFFDTEVSRRQFAQTLAASDDKRMFALSFTENLEVSLEHIKRAGLKTGAMRQIVVPYFSEHTRIHLALIEVLKGTAQGSKQPTITRADSALPAEALRAELRWSQSPPAVLRQGLKETVYVTVRNASDVTWPALGRIDGTYRLLVGNHWLDDRNRIVVNDDGRSIFLYDLTPGDAVEVPVTINAPSSPGTYKLEVDVVQEGATWFGLKGSKTLTATIRVE